PAADPPGRRHRSPGRPRGAAALRRRGAPRNVTHCRYTHSLHAATVAAMRKRRPDVRERFGFAVKDRREELGLTQEDLAERAGIHRTYLSDVERGGRNLSLLNIERLADALALPLSDLFRLVERP